ncbi:MAG: fibronectin type III domain-containing protein [Muribaculaceae bacterium]|nr:fibronectin type III domain-containing protein [Muribaculaceae bacterium]
MNQKILAAALICAFAASPKAEAAGIEHGERPFYGFFLSNPIGFTNADETQYGFAKQTFASPDINELLCPISGGIGLYAATAVDGIYYAVPYLYESSMSMPTPQPMFFYNIYTGQVKEIGAWSDASTDLKPSDMTYDRLNDRILAICYGSQEGSGIYEVNRETGAMTQIRKINEGSGVIASDAFGRVFTINHNGELLQVDMTKDNSTRAIYTLPYRYLAANQSLEFDLTSGKLMWASNTQENPHSDMGSGTWLVEITLPSIAPNADYSADMDGYSYQEYGEIGIAARFLGMYIPYATGGFEAPGFAVDPRSTSSVDGSYCTIDFSVPSTSFGGGAIESIDGYDIYRDGVKLDTKRGPFTSGSALQYEDRALPATGREYRYDIVCYSNTKGDGPKSPVFAYVGFDAPAAVSDPTVTVGSDFISTVISWSAPTVGEHGGTFDPTTTTYDVMRLPDNVKVAENITECSVNDNLRRLLRYSYRITAKNEYGESTAVTREFVAGTPVNEFPVEETFDNPTSMALRWTTVDNNNDGMTWIYGTTLGQSVFGDYEMTAEYIISPTSIDAYTKDADDWIISPPIKFEEGKKYGIQFEIRSLTPEKLNVYVGPMNTVEGMRLVDSFSLREPQYSESRIEFQTYGTELPADIAGTTSCVAVQLATPLNDNYYSYIQLGNILIDEGLSGVDSVVSENTNSFRINGDFLTIAGEFNNAAIYSVNGMKVADIRSAGTSLSGLKGVYILVIDGKSHKVVI